MREAVQLLEGTQLAEGAGNWVGVRTSDSVFSPAVVTNVHDICISELESVFIQSLFLLFNKKKSFFSFFYFIYGKAVSIRLSCHENYAKCDSK